MVAFPPNGDSWSRRSPRKHTLCGLDLSSRKNTSIVLLAGTVLTVVLLTARYRLAHPSDHPYGRAGWSIGSQSYAPSFRWAVPTATGTDETADTVQGGGGFDGDAGWDDYYDWMPPPENTRWDPLTPDTRPITEITIKSCVLPPGLSDDICAPISSKKEDALRGKWVRVDKDLNRRIGAYYLYLFERRLLPNSQAPVITNLTLLTQSPTGSDLDPNGVWVEVSDSIRTSVWPRMKPMFLHYQLTEQSDIRSARKSSATGDAGDLEPITELDVLYGGAEVQPLWGFTSMSTFITGGPDDEKAFNVATGKGTRFGSRLALRRVAKPLPLTPALRFSPEGNFTILQVADLHFSVGPGECRDLDPERERACKRVGADIYSLEWLKLAVAETKPDLVVLSGDQLNGQDSSWSASSTILKWAPALWEAKIPWTIVFGNHDSELDMSRADQMELMQSLPYFIGEAGPSIGGTGNYLKSIKSWDSSNTTLFNLYFLDSHANVKSLLPFSQPGYDFLKPAQLNWFKGKSSRISPYLRPYTPPVVATSSKSKSKATKKPSTKKPSTKKPSSKKPSKKPSAAKLPTVDFGDRRRMSVVRKRQWGEEEDAGGVEVAGGEPGEETAGGEDAVEDAKLDEGAWGEAPVTDAELSASPDEGVDVAGWGAGEQVDEATPLDAAAGDDAWGGEKEVDGDGAAPDAGGASAWGAEKVDSTTTAADDEVGDWGQKMEDTTDTSTSADETAGESTATTGTDEWGATIPSTELDEETSGTASEVEPLPSAFLSPFDEDDYDLPPTILPDGPTHQNPMLAKPNAITFFHIPLVESYTAPVDVGQDGKRLVVGERYEASGASKTNSGMFEAAILKQGELLAADAEIKDEFWEGEFSAPTSGRPEVKVIANGHCHITEDCRRVKGVWLCFGGGASYSGYGQAGFARRMRVYQLSDYGERIETFKFLDTLQVIDRVVLAGEGALGS